MRGPRLGLALCVALVAPMLVATGGTASASGSRSSTDPAVDTSTSRTATVVFDPVGDRTYAHRTWDGVVRAGGDGGLESSAVTIHPTDGERLVRGRVTLAPGAAGQPSVEMGYTCDTSASYFRGGYLDVLDVQYDADGHLTSAAADLSLDCGGTVPTAEVRLASSVPYTSVSVSSRDSLDSYPGERATSVTTLTNDGTATVTPGAARLGTFYPSSTTNGLTPSVTDDGCAGRALEPGQTCRVSVSVPAGGTTVELPVPVIDELVTRAAPPPAVVRSVDVLEQARPAPVDRVTAGGAVDGNAVQWTAADQPGYLVSFSVERKSGSGSWTMLDPVVEGRRYADTSAPTGIASTYRVTPRGRAGYDPTGAALSQASMPVSWSAPAGARTVASANGAPPTGAEGIQSRAGSLTLRTHGAEQMWLGIDSDASWRSGTYVVGVREGAPRACLIDSPSVSFPGPCVPLTGTLTVARAVLRADGTPAELAASFSGSRVGDTAARPVRAIVEISSTAAGLPGYLSASFAPREELPTYVRNNSWDGALYIPRAAGQVEDFAVTLRNLGGAPITPTRTSVAPGYQTARSQSQWTPAPTCVGQMLGAESSCRTSLHFEASEFGYEDTVATWTASDGASTSLLATADADWDMPTMDVQLASATPGGTVHIGLSGADRLGRALTYHCRLDQGAWRTCVPGEALDGLPDGTHTVRAYVETADHRISDWHSASVELDHVAPTTRVVSPGADTVVLAGSVFVDWMSVDAAGGGSPIASHQARHRSTGVATGFGSYVYGPQMSEGRVSASPAGGTEQCWSARATDSSGNTGTWSGERCLIAPLADDHLVSKGFARRANAYAVGKSISSAARTGSTLTLPRVQARQVGVVVSTCSRCGRLAVYLAGKPIGTVSTYGNARARVVRWVPRFSANRTGALQLRTLGPQTVLVDGVLIKHK